MHWFWLEDDLCKLLRNCEGHSVSSQICTIQYNWCLISPFFLIFAKLRSALCDADAIAMQSIMGEELVQGPYVVARAEFEPSDGRRRIYQWATTSRYMPDWRQPSLVKSCCQWEIFSTVWVLSPSIDLSKEFVCAAICLLWAEVILVYLRFELAICPLWDDVSAQSFTSLLCIISIWFTRNTNSRLWNGAHVCTLIHTILMYLHTYMSYIHTERTDIHTFMHASANINAYIAIHTCIHSTYIGLHEYTVHAYLHSTYMHACMNSTYMHSTYIHSKHMHTYIIHTCIDI